MANVVSRGVAAIGLSIALCLALACASGGPTYSELEGTLPGIPSGSGRILFYMTDAVEVPTFRPDLTVDGVIEGEIRAGTFFYLDRPAGVHQLGVHAKPVDAAFGGQGATQPIVLELAPGQRAYIRVDVDAPAGMVMPVLTPETAENGQRDMARLVQIQPGQDP